MENDKLTDLLSRFDETAPMAEAVSGDLAGVVRRRARRQRRTRGIIVKATAMTVVVAIVGMWAISASNNKTGTVEQMAGSEKSMESIAQLEAEVAQLNAKVDSLLGLLEETRIDHRRDKRLVTLQDELSTIADPIEEMNHNINKVAINLLYQADKIRDESLAIEAYRHIIKLFPDNYYANVAREKIKEITGKQVNNNFQKGDMT